MFSSVFHLEIVMLIVMAISPPYISIIMNMQLIPVKPWKPNLINLMIFHFSQNNLHQIRVMA